MKIIKVGRAHPDWKREFECKNCGTVVEIERANLVITFIHTTSGERERVVADCMVCKHEIAIDDPAHDNWGDLPHKSYCQACKQNGLVSSTDLADPRCSNCGNSITVPRAKKNPYR